MSKLRAGKWERAVVTAAPPGAMVRIDHKTKDGKVDQLTVNRSKLRKDHDEWHDVVIPGVGGRDGEEIVTNIRIENIIEIAQHILTQHSIHGSIYAQI